MLVTACSSPPPKRPTVDDNYNYGSPYMWQMNSIVNDDAVRYMTRRFQADGGQIISVGQDYKLIFPVQGTFYFNSPRIQWPAYKLLNDVAAYMRLFNKVDVKVVAFTRATGDSERDLALSWARARNVADYLWSQRVGASVMYTRGYVAMNQVDRIEISFRHVLV